jgi:flagellar hook-associated protein 2
MNATAGLAGLDVHGIVADLINIQRKPISSLESKQQVINAKAKIFSDISSRVASLKTNAAALNNESAFEVYAARYSTASVISATASTGASNNSYNIEVSSIAKAHTIGSDKLGSTSEALGFDGTFTINDKEIIVKSTDSLTDIMHTINSVQDTGINASIVDNVLRLKSNTTGTESEISLEDRNGGRVLRDLGIHDESDAVKNEFVAAVDAVFTIDGQIITKSNNTISDLIEGVRFTLLKEDKVTLTIERDSSAIISKIQDFVNQYNSVMDFIYSKTSERKIVPAANQADQLVGLVSGDSSLVSLRFNLGRMMTDNVDGLSSGLNNLASIGITRSGFAAGANNSAMNSGKLNIDIAKLTDAIANDIESVKDLFIQNKGAEGLDNANYGIAARVENYVSNLTNTSSGFFSNKTSGFNNEVKMIQSRMDALHRNIALRETFLTKQFTALNSALSAADSQMAWLQTQLMQF